ncbi:GrpB family protein [Nigerium massiliense]|uniref:GrpB family protein n=1 Tax=Nigerium massiliense TaxID=1522317 RepID=UPI000907777A
MSAYRRAVCRTAALASSTVWSLSRLSGATRRRGHARFAGGRRNLVALRSRSGRTRQDEWRRRLAFRDLLRKDPVARDEYLQAKLKAAATADSWTT